MFEHKRIEEVLGRPTAVARLMAQVIDSFEKLEITMYLYRVRYGSRPTGTIADALSLSPPATWEALAALARVGVIRTVDPDEAGWWFDPNGRWAAGVEALATLYADDRVSVIEMMTRAALDRLRDHAVATFVSTRERGSRG